MDNLNFDANQAHFVSEATLGPIYYKPVTKKPYTIELIAVIISVLAILLSIFTSGKVLSDTAGSLGGLLLGATLGSFIMRIALQGRTRKVGFCDNGVAIESFTSPSVSQFKFEYAFIKICRITDKNILIKIRTNITLTVQRGSLLDTRYYDLIQFLNDIMRNNGVKVIWDKRLNISRA